MHVYTHKLFIHVMVFIIITVCGSTSRDRTHTTSRGCVLLWNCVEYIVIAMSTPVDKELLLQRVFYHL